MSQSVIALGLFLGTLLVGVFFAYIYSLKRQNYLLYWTVGWALYALHYLCPALSPWIGTNIVLSSLNHALFGFAAICFFLGAQLYTHHKLWLKPAIGAAALLALWSAANAFQVFSVSSFIPAAFIYVVVGYLFWNESRHHETLADRLLGLAFSFWGVVFLLFFLLPSAQKSIGDSILAVSAVPVAFVCMLLVMAIYEEEKRRVERNMLALSNLNLATSSFPGREIQKMLAQALDRVLSVARIEAGALCMRDGEADVPGSVVETGMGETFCATIQQDNLDEYVVSLVAR